MEDESSNGLFGKDASYTNAGIVQDFVQNLFEIKQIDNPDDIPTTSEKYYGGVASVFVNEISGSQSFAFGILNVNRFISTFSSKSRTT